MYPFFANLFAAVFYTLIFAPKHHLYVSQMILENYISKRSVYVDHANVQLF